MKLDVDNEAFRHDDDISDGYFDASKNSSSMAESVELRLDLDTRHLYDSGGL